MFPGHQTKANVVSFRNAPQKRAERNLTKQCSAYGVERRNLNARIEITLVETNTLDISSLSVARSILLPAELHS